MIKAVLFDFDETLQDRTLAFEGYMDAVLKKYFPDIDEKTAREYKDDMVKTGNGGYVNRIEWYQALLEKWGYADRLSAKELAEQRKAEDKRKQQSQYTVSLDDLFSRIQEGNMKELNIIVKADVQGSAEAVKSSLEKISNEEVRVRVIHSAVGAINESDVMLANASNAIIVGFNIRPETAARASAEKNDVDIRLYSIIYDCIEEIESAMKGMLAPKYKEVILGYAEVRQVFKASGVGTIAGCYVKEGKIVRNSNVRLIRDNTVVFTGNLSSLKRFKDDAKEVLENFECGLTIENYNDIKEGDIIEAYEMQEIKQ